MDRYERTYSKRYEETKELSHKELAKLIRKEARAYMKQYNQKYKISVKLSDYDVINVEIQLTEKENPYSKGYTNSIIANDDDYLRNSRLHRRYNNEITKIIRDLENIRNAFNHNASDSYTDYFDVRYCGNTNFNAREMYSDIKENPEEFKYTEEEEKNYVCG